MTTQRNTSKPVAGMRQHRGVAAFLVLAAVAPLALSACSDANASAASSAPPAPPATADKADSGKGDPLNMDWSSAKAGTKTRAPAKATTSTATTKATRSHSTYTSAANSAAANAAAKAASEHAVSKADVAHKAALLELAADKRRAEDKQRQELAARPAVKPFVAPIASSLHLYTNGCGAIDNGFGTMINNLQLGIEATTGTGFDIVGIKDNAMGTYVKVLPFPAAAIAKSNWKWKSKTSARAFMVSTAVIPPLDARFISIFVAAKPGVVGGPVWPIEIALNPKATPVAWGTGHCTV